MKRGRKTETLIEGTKAVTMTLDDLTVEMLKVLGGGNISRGARVAARWTFEAYQRGQIIRGMPMTESVAAPADGLPPAKSPASLA